MGRSRLARIVLALVALLFFFGAPILALSARLPGEPNALLTVLKDGVRKGKSEFLNVVGKAVSLDCSGSSCALTFFPASEYTAGSVGLHCDYSTDDTATLRAAIEGGVLAGRTLRVPSGCKVLLGTPGSGDSVADFPSNTRIECEDKTAGFVLSRKSCSAASQTPGAACTADNQCKSGTCVSDPGGPFAPVEANTYTVFAAATSATGPAIKNCSIWTNGGSGTSLALGDGKRWGYCNGGGTSTLGEGCYTACNSAAGVLEGFECTADGQCGAGQCVAVKGDCKTLGGTCTSVPYSTNFAASGAGKITPINFSNATSARIENVTIYDHRRGDISIDSGIGATVRDTTTFASSLSTPQGAFAVPAYGLQASVLKGIYARNGAVVDRSVGAGWTAGIHASSNVTVSGSQGLGLGDPSQTGWDGSVGLLISNDGVVAQNFRGNGGLYCVMPEYASGYNFLVSQAFCDANVGPKFIVSGSGNQYIGVRGAWSGRGSIVGLGDQRGRCSVGSTRAGKVCIFGANTDATIGCPSGTCDPHADFKAGSSNHFVIGGGSLLHTDCPNVSGCSSAGAVSYIRATDSLRCEGGTNAGIPCTTDGGCNSGACRPLQFTNAVIDGVMLYAGMNNTGIDLSTSSVGVHKYDGIFSIGGASINNWVVSGIDFHAHANGIKFPTNTKRCVRGTNNGNTCTSDADCTGTPNGVCTPPVIDFVASGLMAGVTTPLTNWDAAYGDISGLKGLAPWDEQGPGLVNLTAGETLTRGQSVMVSTAAARTVLKTTTSLKEKAIGVVQNDVYTGGIAKVLVSGTGICYNQASSLNRGDLLTSSNTTDGRIAKSTSSSDLLIGSALENASSNSTFLCMIGTAPAVQTTSAAWPKIVTDKADTSTSFLQACSASVGFGLNITQSITGSKVILDGSVGVNNTGSAATIAVIEIQKGGSGCDSGSPTTLATFKQMVAGSDDNGTISFMAEDTSPSGSTTYRVCLCSEPNQSGTMAATTDSMMRLIELP